MTTRQIIRFLENGDSTAIQFRQFNLSPKDQYPTFSICLTGSDIHWNKANTIFRRFGLHPSNFGQLLKGEDVYSYDYNYTSMLYNKNPVDISQYQNLDLERLSLKISDILTGHEFRTEKETNSVSYGMGKIGKMIEKIPLDLGYNTSDSACFTRSSDEQLDTLRIHDLLSFNKSVFGNERYRNVILRIFVHYPRQLMRSFHRPVFQSMLSDFPSNILKITIGKVSILRKRPDSNVPCDEKLFDDDAKFQDTLIKHINCTPVYWNGRNGDDFPQEKCMSKVDLQIADAFIQEYKAMLKSYDSPCNQMEVFSKYDDKEPNEWDDRRVKFMYADSVYEEVENTRSFDLESFVSGVGGFIGIFLGYSILQVPELLGFLASFMKSVKQGNKTGKIDVISYSS